MWKKSKTTLLLCAATIAVCISGSALAANPIQLFVNDQRALSDTAPIVKDDRVFVPIRWVAEALGAKVNWDERSRSVHIYENNPAKEEPVSEQPRNEDRRLAQYEKRVLLLEQFLAPASADEAAELFAEAVKRRNGAVQFALLSNDLQQAAVDQYEDAGWVTGVSSPWVERYTVTPVSSDDSDEHVYKVEFHLATSTGDAGRETSTITVAQTDGRWVITEADVIAGFRL